MNKQQSTSLQELHQAMKRESNKEKAQVLQRFFKTGKGEYGEGDIFIGLTVPQCRKFVSLYKNLVFEDIHKLVQSPIHEERLVSLLLLVDKYKKGSDDEKNKIYKLYLQSTCYINNWDLVDLSAEHIVGPSLTGKGFDLIKTFARSSLVWERRISILSTFYCIKKGSPLETLEISTILLHDSHDLIQKAVGWMLREVGKRCSTKVLEHFLDSHLHEMPRTMLRYSIERFPEEKRLKYLHKKTTFA